MGKNKFCQFRAELHVTQCAIFRRYEEVYVKSKSLLSICDYYVASPRNSASGLFLQVERRVRSVGSSVCLDCPLVTSV